MRICDWSLDVCSSDLAGRRRRRSLNVVVKCAETITVAVEQVRCIGLCEILPLHHGVRPSLGNRRDKRFNEIVVPLSPYALMAPSEIKRTLQQFLVLRPPTDPTPTRIPRIQTENTTE